MTAPKVGDRVHVEYEGVVQRCNYDNASVDVHLDDGNFQSAMAWSRHCTVIKPTVVVGDVVTRQNIGQLPDGSVVVSDDGLAAQLLYDNERTWWTPGSDINPVAADTIADHWAARVVHIGGGS